MKWTKGAIAKALEIFAEHKDLLAAFQIFRKSWKKKIDFSEFVEFMSTFTNNEKKLLSQSGLQQTFKPTPPPEPIISAEAAFELDEEEEIVPPLATNVTPSGNVPEEIFVEDPDDEEYDAPGTLADGDPRRVVYIPDTHIPRHNVAAWKCLLAFIKEFKPEAIVIIGDFGDFQSVSTHPRTEPDTIKYGQEVKAINEALDELEAVRPEGCIIYYIEGNHERRVTKRVNESSYLDKLMDLPANLGITPFKIGIKTVLRKDVRWISYEEQPLFVGKHTACYHGHLAGSSKSHAAKHAETYATSSGRGRTVFYGHNHTFQMARSDAGKEAVCIGFLGSKKSLKYTDGKPSPWVCGFVMQEVTDIGDGAEIMSYTFVRIRKGKAVLHGKVIEG